MKDILKSCEDIEKLTDVIDSDYGVGVTFSNDSVEYISVLTEPERQVFLHISSWIGVSPMAEHYYGKLTVYDFSLKILKSKDHSEVGDVISICGAFIRPPETSGFDIILIRPVTDAELKTEKFNDCFPGSTTTRFRTRKEVLALGKKIFKKRFAGNWKLIIE